MRNKAKVQKEKPNLNDNDDDEDMDNSKSSQQRNRVFNSLSDFCNQILDSKENEELTADVFKQQILSELQNNPHKVRNEKADASEAF